MINKILNANNSNLLLHNGRIVFDIMRTKTFEEVATGSTLPRPFSVAIKMQIMA